MNQLIINLLKTYSKYASINKDLAILAILPKFSEIPDFS